MNDRASKMPPAEFISEEGLREAHRARSRVAQQPSTAGPAAEKIETARQSGIFRFGKSFAATFNPANWKIWKPQPQQLDETAEQKSLRERQEKAERIYKELKETGKFRDSAHPPSFHVTDYDGSTVKRDGNRGKQYDAAMKHDSGIAFDATIGSGVTSREEKRHGRVFIDPPDLLSDGENNSDPYTVAASRTSLQTTRQLSTTQAEPPSPSPRKLRSASRTGPGSRRRSLSIPRMRKGSINFTASTTSPRASESEDPSRTSPGGNLRRVRSRSDLRKQKRHQRRLVKRVSDLEDKLVAARQELSDAAGGVLSPRSQSQLQSPEKAKTSTPKTVIKLQHPTPKPQQSQHQLNTARAHDCEVSGIRITRTRFVPGALATLPSERLLSEYVQSEPGQNEDPDDEASEGSGAQKVEEGEKDVVDGEGEVDVSQIGRAVSTDYGVRREGFEWPDYVF
jgi:hypothetical protein